MPNITEEQYEEALEMLRFHEAKVEYLKKITRKYMYDWESQRVQDRKADSHKFYSQKTNKIQQ